MGHAQQVPAEVLAWLPILEHRIVQAKLHIALDLNEETSDQGYSVTQGPPATLNHTSRIEMVARRQQSEAAPGGVASPGALARTSDPSLQHTNAQVLMRSC